MRIRNWVAILLLSFALGCGDRRPALGGKPSPKVYQSVVSLSPGTSELAILTFGRKILGRTASCDLPPEVTQIEVVMKGVKPNYERIAQLKPDCVLYDPDLFPEADIAKFKELGIDTFAIGGDTIDQFIDRLFEFGRFSNSAGSVSNYADKIYRERETALADKLDPPVTTALVVPGNGYEHMIAGTDGIVADIIRAGGAEPVGPKGRIFVQLNAESLIKLDPELIIVAGQPEEFTKDPRFKTLRAVVHKHVFGTNPSVTLRRGAFMEKFVKRVSQLAHVTRQK